MFNHIIYKSFYLEYALNSQNSPCQFTAAASMLRSEANFWNGKVARGSVKEIEHRICLQNSVRVCVCVIVS